MASTGQTTQERLAERTLHSLINNYSFDPSKAEQAVAAIGDKGDVGMAVSWLLDHGEEDRGGAISLKRCPHLDYLEAPLADPSTLRFGQPCADGCPCGENWVCLFCAGTRCSRYVNGHCLAHWKQTAAEQERTLTVAEASKGKQALGHHLAISLSDLSVWCYACEAYVEHDAILPHCEALRKLKFGEAANAPSSAMPATTADAASSSAVEIRVGDPLAGPSHIVHGTKGDPMWEPPRVVAACATAARPGYRTCAAHEYKDSSDVLRAKIRLLAEMLRAATHATAYTGAGISTASGINDYATKSSRESAKPRISPLHAAPSYGHRALTALHAARLLEGGWVQQNHDGLPQKSGLPQAAINEIHGAWFDPSNPVVPMDGTLRPDLIEALERTIAKTDLCLVAGTSLCGMNADRVATTTARRALRDNQTLGTVIINLQRTVVDGECQLRIYATIDEALRLLVEELGLSVPDRASCAAPVPCPGHEDVFEVPYDAEGRRSSTATTLLDLRRGSRLKIVGQPDWDAERCGTVGTVMGKDESGNYVIHLPWGGDRKGRTLGAWWVAAAQEGSVPTIPVAKC